MTNIKFGINYTTEKRENDLFTEAFEHPLCDTKDMYGYADTAIISKKELEELLTAGRREALEALHKEYQKHHESFNQMVKGKILRSELYTMQTDEQILQSLQNKSNDTTGKDACEEAKKKEWYDAGCMAERILWKDKCEALEKRVKELERERDDMMGMLSVNQALDAAREREGAIGFMNWYHNKFRPMVLRSRSNKQEWRRLVRMSDDELYDLYLQSLQNDKP